MEPNILSITILVMLTTAILLAILPVKHTLFSFQQNRYELPRYTEWWRMYIPLHKGAFIVPLVFALILLLVPIITPSWTLNIVALVVISLSYLIIGFVREKNKKYIKPLKYTGRVWRQIIVMILLLTITTLLILLFVPMHIWGLLYINSILGPWLFIYLVYYITYPAEEYVRKYYINDAKKILKGHKDLIKIGITGSYGKTSTKNILQEILSEKFYSLMTPASFNTSMGVTIAIRNYLKPLHQVFICEMGADKVDEIGFLTRFVENQFGLVTTIGPQHLNTFKTIENIMHEKMKMIENVPEGGVGFMNKDNEYIRNYPIKNPCKKVYYGMEQEDVDFRAIDIQYSPQGSKFNVVTSSNEKHEFTTRLLGEHNIMNILASIAIGRELGIEWDQLKRAVKKVKYVEHRLEVKKINGYTFIDNAFNSNPVSARVSLDILSGMPGKRVIITPGMIELGEQEEEANREFGRQMLGKVDKVILVGINRTKPIQEGLKETSFPEQDIIIVKTVKEAFEYVYQNLSTEDTMLIENDLPDVFNN